MASDEEPRVPQRPMAAGLPVVEVFDVFLVEEDFQIVVQAPAEILFQFGVQFDDKRAIA